MNIKDFKPGQTVFALSRTRGRTTEHFIKRYTVISVDRKYVKAAPEDSWLPIEFYKVAESNEYLTENKDWGDRLKLFPTEQAATDDIEQDMLKGWVRKATDNYSIDSYTLQQLRAVREILEGNRHE